MVRVLMSLIAQVVHSYTILSQVLGQLLADLGGRLRCDSLHNVLIRSSNLLGDANPKN